VTYSWHVLPWIHQLEEARGISGSGGYRCTPSSAFYCVQFSNPYSLSAAGQYILGTSVHGMLYYAYFVCTSSQAMLDSCMISGMETGPHGDRKTNRSLLTMIQSGQGSGERRDMSLTLSDLNRVRGAAPLAGTIVLASSSLFQDTTLRENVDESPVSTTSPEPTFAPRHVPKRVTAV
jgi:hypothetical protein